MRLGPVCTLRRAGVRPRAGVALSCWLLAVVGAATACTNDGGSARDDDPPAEPVHYATYSDTSALGEGDGALLDGTLRTSGGCLVVEVSDGSLVVPVLPNTETTWDGGAERLTVGSVAHRVGDTVRFGGGYVTDTSPFDLPDACAEVGEHFLVSTP